jgi:integrase/recombinase XerC/integrase/recombinase XerD
MELVLNNNNNLSFEIAKGVVKIVNWFIAELDVKESSKSTYKRQIRLFFRWVGEVGHKLSQLTRIQLIEYKKALLGSGKSSLTAGGYLTAVRKFYEWTEAHKLYPNIAKGIKSPKRIQKFKKQALTIEKSKELVKLAEDLPLRDKALINLLIRGGLRTIEVSRANIEDIVYQSGERLLMLHRKGRDEKDKFIVLTDKVYQPIKDYLESRIEVTPETPLFVSSSNNSKGERLSTRTISGIAKDNLKEIGLDSKAFTAHSLRHTTATNIRRAGGSLEDIQQVLGHESITTSQIYDRMYREEQRIKNAPERLLDTFI